MQLIVGDKRVNVTMRAKDAMIVITALKGEELHKAGLPSRYIEVRRVPPATCHLVGGRGQRAEGSWGYRACYLPWCVLISTVSVMRVTLLLSSDSTFTYRPDPNFL